MPIQAYVNGRLGADAELAYGKDGGTPFLKLRVATDSGYGKDKKTDWVSVTVFGKRGEKLAPFLTKGKQAIFVGVLTGREYEGAKGKGFSLDLVANDVVFIDGGKKDEASEATETIRSGPASNADFTTAAPF